ncbi:MAG: DNA-processing protein DprA [Acidimicrobiales bacterium]
MQLPEQSSAVTRTPGEDSYAASIAALGCGRSTMRRILNGQSPSEAWQAIIDRVHPEDPDGSLAARARSDMPVVFSRRLQTCGASVLVRGHCGFPAALLDDPDAPEVLFCLGDPQVLTQRPRVSVVGTRSATRYGSEVASELGRDLAAAGVVVVSGLAAGIDSAAHAGALRHQGDASPVAVIATGIDIAYPRSNVALRDAVAEQGAVFSELPPGVPGERWRFADRNRLMAALSHVVVVVECHAKGGSLYTVKAARKRGIDVMAVPGSVRSPASSGTNALLADGALVARDVLDVLTAVELATTGDRSVLPPIWPKADTGASNGARSVKPPSATSARLYGFIEAEPASLEMIVIRSGCNLGQVSLALEELSQLGLVDTERGWWWRSGKR